MKYYELLSMLYDFEYKLAVMYEIFSKNYANDNEACALFSKMCTEEVNHSDAVKYLMRTVKGNAPGEVSVDADLGQMEAVIGKVDDTIKSELPIPVDEAVRFALFLENNSLELLYKTASAQVDPKFVRLVEYLNSGSTEHQAKIERLARKRGLLPEEAA